MNTNQNKMIRLLFESDQTIKAEVLAAHLNVSIRTIKNYVHDINQMYPHAIKSTHTGYLIEKHIAKKILNTYSHIPQTSKERVVYIINAIIKSPDPIDLYDLCDQMFISLSTIKSELIKVKRKIQKFDLELLTHHDYVTIEGLEKNKRKLLSSMLYEESQVNFINLKAIQESFCDIDISYIKMIVTDILKEHHYFINDYSLINLILHIAITVDRICHNHNNNDDDIRYIKDDQSKDLMLADKIIDQLNSYFHIHFSKAESYELALLLKSRTTSINYEKIDAKELPSYIDDDCIHLVYEILDAVNSIYYINFENQDFFVRFTLHIHNLLIRSQNNYLNKNPLAEGIKTSCPFIYEISVFIADMIQQRKHIILNEDEIAYIAFHLGSAIETQNNKSKKIKTILFCPNYYDMNLRIIDSLRQQFSEDIFITYVCVDESELLDLPDHIEFVITTIPLMYILSIPFVQISTFMNKNDINIIRQKTQMIKIQKQRKEFQGYLQQLISPQLFEINSTFSNEKDTIQYMVQKLVKEKYVDSSFLDDVIEREKMSSTAYGMFAIPHSVRMDAHKTGMNILISKKDILWNEKAINLVIMLCFHPKERYLFNEIFEPLALILNDANNVQQLLTCHSYQEFISLISSMLL